MTIRETSCTDQPKYQHVMEAASSPCGCCIHDPLGGIECTRIKNKHDALRDNTLVLCDCYVCVCVRFVYCTLSHTDILGLPTIYANFHGHRISVGIHTKHSPHTDTYMRRKHIRMNIQSDAVDRWRQAKL